MVCQRFCLNCCEKVRPLIKPLCILILLYFIVSFVLLRANYNNLDDTGREVHTYREWDNFSRYTSYYLSPIIHANKILSDISPLTQILALVILAAASIIVIYGITEQTKISWWCMVAVLPLGLSPYFLECLSYKFDSPYMALSVLASVFPVLFMRKKRLCFFRSRYFLRLLSVLPIRLQVVFSLC